MSLNFERFASFRSSASRRLRKVATNVASRYVDECDCENKYKVWSLLESSFHGEENVVKRLIEEKKVDLNYKDSLTGDTAVHKAVKSNKADVLSLLLENGANCDQFNDDNESPLLIAVNSVFEKCVQILVANDSNVNLRNSKGITALKCALLNYKICLNDENDDNTDTLKKIITTLIESPKFDLNSETSDGPNFFKFAVLHGIDFVVEKFIEMEPKLFTLKAYKNINALHIAALRGHFSILSILLNNTESDINALNNNKETPLHMAIESWESSTIKLLVSKGADCNATDKFGFTPLHNAFRKPIYKLSDRMEWSKSKEFIDKPLNVNGNVIEQFPLRLAVALYLIENGNADITIRNKFGKTPLDVIITKPEATAHCYKGMVFHVVSEKRKQSLALEEKIKSLNDEKDKLLSELICQICMDNKRSVVFNPCGHGACNDCVQNLERCHICRKDFQGILNIY